MNVKFAAIGLIALVSIPSCESAQEYAARLDDPMTVLKSCNAYNHALEFMIRMQNAGVLNNNQIAATDAAVAAMSPVCESRRPTTMSMAAMTALDAMISAQLQVEK